AVLNRVGGIYTVDTTDGAILVDEGLDRVHTLNASASLLWSCLDGASTLAEIAADIASEMGADPAVVRKDVVATAEHLASEGLVTPGADRRATARESERPSLASDRARVRTGFAASAIHETLLEVSGHRVLLWVNNQAVGTFLDRLLKAHSTTP